MKGAAVQEPLPLPELNTAPGQQEFLRLADGWVLASGRGGPVAVSPDLRRLVAIFDNGVVVVSRGMRHSLEVKAVLDRARHAGLRPAHFCEADVPFLMEVYAQFDGHRAGAERDTPDIERQKDLARLIDQACRNNASDIHMRVLATYAEVKIRVNGRMRQLQNMSAEEGQAIIRAAFAVASGQGASGTDSTFQQGALTPRSGLLPPRLEMIRLQYTPTSEQRGALVMRLKYTGRSGEIDVDSLGYSAAHVADLRKMRLKTNGMYIFSGKVSSGKTTTLQRCLNAMYMEKRGEISIYAAEDPQELELPGAIQAQISAGQNANEAFRTAMRAALRSDPNVIVLGEIRSEELVSMAIEAAKTGHALWSTVHAGSALGILNRLLNLGADREDLKDPRTVGGLIYQRLVGVMCPHCRVPFGRAVGEGALEADLAARFVALSGQPAEALFVRGPGCRACQSGLVGRTVVAEIIRPDSHLLELYMNDSRVAAERYWMAPPAGGGLGGAPVLHHALIKVGAGIADLNEIQEEVDLLETYEREMALLTDQLRAEIVAMRARGAPGTGGL